MAAKDLAVWRVQMFNGLRVQQGARSVDHFDTRRAASLLAYFAFYPHRAHPREELAEMLWPDEDMDVTRLRLRQVLNTIRRALDSPDGAKDGLLLSDRTFARVNAEHLTTDVREFESLRKSASQTEDIFLRVDKLQQAVALYQGDLLPGFYEDWVEQERRRLQEAYRETLLRLAASQGESGDLQGGLESARKIIAVHTLDEEANQVYIRLCAQAGRPAEALRQYQTLEQALWKELRTLPSLELQALTSQIRGAGIAPALPAQKLSALPAANPPVLPRSMPAAPSSASTEEEIMEAAAPSIAVAPPVATALTPFFGRQQEIKELTVLLRPPQSAPATGPSTHVSRLVTLVGQGGSGKTRLAQEVARELQSAYAQRVWFVSLADIQDGARIPEKIAEAIYPDSAPDARALERVVEELNRQPTLLALDNFEQVTATGTNVIQELLERAGSLRCLVTSRQTLNLAGERRFDVPPLPTPEPVAEWAREGEQGTDETREEWEQVAQTPSVQLFTDRARNVLPQFEITPQNADCIAQICRYVEGVPLSLELAAAWMAVLEPAQLLQRLQDRFTLLVNQQDSAPSRHRSLYATVEWSYEQLAPPAQCLFANLSVFRNGWTLEAAEAVGEEPQTFAYLTQLLRHSLISREGGAGGGRFRMLETLRDFVGSRLEEARRERLRERHAAYYLELAERASEHLTGSEQAQWLERLQEENDNLRAALDWCVEAADRQSPTAIASGLRFVTALWRFWEVRCSYGDAEHWIEKILASSLQADPVLRARTLESAGNFALNARAHAQAQSRVEASVRLYQDTGEMRGLGSALSVLGAILRDQGDVNAAKPMFAESLRIMRETRNTFGIARALGGLGIIAALENDAVEAHSLLEQSAAMYRICGHRKGIAWCYYERGLVAGRQGDNDLSLTLFLEGLPVSRLLRDGVGIGFACFNIGAAYQQRGEYARAGEAAREALQAARRGGLIAREVVNLMWLGDLACDQDEWARGERYFKAALTRAIQRQFHPGTLALLERLAILACKLDKRERAVCLISAAQSLPNMERLDHPNPPRFLSGELGAGLRQVSALPEFAHVRARADAVTGTSLRTCA